MPIGKTAQSSRFDVTAAPAVGSPFNIAEEKFSAGQSFVAAGRDLNLFANGIDFAMRHRGGGSFRPDANFNIDEALSLGDFTDTEKDFLSSARSDEEFFHLSTTIHRARRRKAAMGQNLFASLAGAVTGAVLDPITFLPFLGTGQKAAKAGRFATKLLAGGTDTIAGAGLARLGRGAALTVRGASGQALPARIAAGAVLGGGEEIIREAALQNLQIERSLEESAANVFGGALLGGVLFPVAGEVVGGVTKPLRRMAKDSAQDSMRHAAKGRNEIPGVVTVQDQIIAADKFAVSVVRDDFSDPAAQAAARRILFGTPVNGDIAESAARTILPENVNVNDPAQLFGGLSGKTMREGDNVARASVNERSASFMRQTLVESGVSRSDAVRMVRSTVAVARGEPSREQLKDAITVIGHMLGYDSKVVARLSSLSDAQISKVIRAKTAKDIGDAVDAPLPNGARNAILFAKNDLLEQPLSGSAAVPESTLDDMAVSIRAVFGDGSESNLDDLVGAAAVSMGGNVDKNIAKLSTELKDLGKVSAPLAKARADDWSRSLQWYTSTRDGEIALYRSRVAIEAPRMAKDLRVLNKELEILRKAEGDDAPETGDTLAVLGDRVQDMNARLKQIDELTDKASTATDAAEKEAINRAIAEEKLMIGIAMKEVSAEVADRKAAASAGFLGMIRMARVSPRTMLLTSISPVVRKLTIQGTTLASITNADLRGTGIAFSAETERAAWQSFAGDTISRYEHLHRKSGLSASDFNRRVYRVLSGVSRGATDNSKEVIDAAMNVRSLLGQLGIAGQKVGLFDSDLIEDYIERAYNRRAIVNDIDGFKSALIKHIELGNKLPEGRSSDDVADSVISGIIKTGSASSESATKGRTVDFGIDFSHPDFEQYITKDIPQILKGYTRNISGRIAFRHAYGNLSVDELRRIVSEDYERLIRDNQGNKKMLNKITKDRKHILGDGPGGKGYLDAMFDDLNGSFSHTAFNALPESVMTASAVATNSIVAAKSWGFALAQVVDAANIARVAGARAFFKHVPTFGKALVDVIRGARADDLRELAILSDSSRLGSETLAFGRMNMSDPTTNVVIEGTRILAHKSMKVSGMLAATDAIKRVASITVLDKLTRIAKTVADGGKVSKGDQLMIARAGLDVQTLKAFTDNIDTNVKYGRAEIPAIHKWSDTRAAAKVEFGIKRLMSDIMPEAGILDKPLWLSNPAFRIFGILRGYTLSSATRLTAQSAQQIIGNPADMRVYMAMLIASSMGVMEFALRQGIKDTANGNDPAERWRKMSLEQVAAVAFDRSGYPAIASEANGLVEGAFGRGIPGLSAVFDTAQSAFAADPSDPATFPAKSFAEALMGPGGSIANSAVRASGKLVAPGENDDRAEQAKRLADSLPILGFMHIGRVGMTVAESLAGEEESN